MVRRYDDPVEVRPAEGAAPDEDPAGRAPAAFLWQGRLYVVRAVLGSWHERRAWWRDAAARAVHGELPASPVPVGGAVPQGPQSARAGSGLGDEQTVWRVEAGAGRLRGLGVFDLVHDPAGGGAGCWRLLRVVD